MAAPPPHLRGARHVRLRRFPAAEEGGAPVYTSAAAQPLPFLDPPDTFRTEQPDPDAMGFRELDRHIETLRARGLDVVSLVVAPHRKVALLAVSGAAALHLHAQELWTGSVEVSPSTLVIEEGGGVSTDCA